ncbi:hypothetical protein KCP69_23950 [Salmonella enterica subsp. enterica]|nr:hypothetical protein KCP69_23950 [Salmonella enterica subsp. enterica]
MCTSFQRDAGRRLTTEEAQRSRPQAAPPGKSGLLQTSQQLLLQSQSRLSQMRRPLQSG